MDNELPPLRKAFAYSGRLSSFLEQGRQAILGALGTQAAARHHWGTTDHAQVHAWEESLDWLETASRSLTEALPATSSWVLCLEYEIPRRGGRIDALLLADDIVFVIEFKATKAGAAAIRQAEDYALELLDFHEESHHLQLFPIVCAGGSREHKGDLSADWGVATATVCRPAALERTLVDLHARFHRPERVAISPESWLRAAYDPTPTIIEAAQALYAGHSIRELSQSEASAEHLRRTQEAVMEVVRDAQARGKNTICFITGVPGAGKTLAGLNVVHGLPQTEAATFLSGNGPLVKVLQEVLARDIVARESITKSTAKRRATTLVTNVHRWLDEYIDKKPDQAPHERVVVFDEAQRAWSREHSLRKFKRDASEPEMMLNAMGRRRPSVIVGLVGGGQEINTGEAGLSEWGRALNKKFTDWEIVVSPLMSAGELAAGSALFPSEAEVPHARLRTNDDLHLAVTQRSYRSKKLSSWVELVLAGEPDKAYVELEYLQRYPIVMTRDLEQARAWLRDRTRGLRRSGLLASSGARRLRPHGISVRERISEVDWFLQPVEDVRSSNFLELAISEFGVQGLEVDWACLAWGGDLTRSQGTWNIRSFIGTAWKQVQSPENRTYAINRYRVLLTRAREGMVLWIPTGDANDVTRDPRSYDSVYEYLSACGVKTIGS